MSIITTGSFSATGLIAGIYKAVGVKAKDFPTIYDKVFNIEKSNRNYQEDVMISGLSLAQKLGEGEDIKFDTMAERWRQRYTHSTYGTAIQITKEALDDQQAGSPLMEKKAIDLVRAMMQKKERVAADIFNNAFTAAYAGGDGKELLALDHPTDTTTFQNELTTAADLSESSLEQAIIDISNQVDQRGLKLNNEAVKLYIPKDLVFEAKRILTSTGRPGTPDNDINAIKSMGLLQNVVASNYLTDTDAWFIITDAPNGLKYLSRQAVEMSSDVDFSSDNLRIKAKERYSFGWTDPRGCFGSAGAA